MGKHTAADHFIAENNAAPRQYELLLVEDEEVSRLYLHTLLTSMGYRVTSAETGEEALSEWSEHDFHLLILDIQLPVLSGIEVAERIREKEKRSGRRRTPIVALTAYSSAEDRQRIREAEMDRYLTKPVEAAALEQVLNELRQKHYGGPGNAEPSSSPQESAAGASSVPFGRSQRYDEPRTIDTEAVTPQRHHPSGEPREEAAEGYAARLRREFGGSSETLSQMAEMSLGELPQLLEQLDEAISSRAEEEGARCAHSLANVTGILFAGDIRDAALKIEELVRGGEFAAARRSYRNVVGKCARLMEELQDL